MTMNIEIKMLTRHLILKSLDLRSPIPLLAMLPQEVTFDNTYRILCISETEPHFESELEKAVDFYSCVIAYQLEQMKGA